MIRRVLNDSGHWKSVSKKDRKAPGVILSVSKSDMLIDLVRLVQDEVIGLGDLSDFSEDVQERVKFMVQRW